MTDTITVRGFAGNTPEIRYAESGKEVTTLRLGSTPRWRNVHTGEWSSGSTNWYTVAAFGRLADNVAASIRKGDPVVVVGRPKVRDWENQDGVTGTDMEISAQCLAHDLTFGRTAFTKVSASASRTTESGESGSQDNGGERDPDAVAQHQEGSAPQEPQASADGVPAGQQESGQDTVSAGSVDSSADPITGWPAEPTVAGAQ